MITASSFINHSTNYLYLEDKGPVGQLENYFELAPVLIAYNVLHKTTV